MHYIYALTYSPNGKKYVGMTKNVYKRFYNHRCDLLNGNHVNERFQKDFDKTCGNILVDILEEVSDSDNPREREIYWINKLKTYDPNIGYNDKDPKFCKNIKLAQNQSENQDLFGYYTTIKGICKSKKITISKLENDLNIARGGLCKWKIHKPNSERIREVANYLGVSTSQIYGLEVEKDDRDECISEEDNLCEINVTLTRQNHSLGKISRNLDRIAEALDALIEIEKKKASK